MYLSRTADINSLVEIKFNVKLIAIKEIFAEFKLCKYNASTQHIKNRQKMDRLVFFLISIKNLQFV